jgi:NHL repeat-containing protein
MKLNVWIVVAFALCSTVSVAAAGEAKFTKEPTATKAGDFVKIEFAIDRETDVAVFIEDGKGTVIRHLVAGVLGKNPPPPLKPNSLEQEIIWDRKDDAGKPVAGAVTVRVRLGLGAKLNRFIPGSTSHIQTPATAFGVGKDGEVYVLSNRGHKSCYMYVLSREGKYLRTILPTPVNVPDEKRMGLERLTLKDGSKVPVVYQGNAAHLAPFLSGIRRQQLAVTKDGLIVFASGGSDYSDQSVPRHLLAVNADGSTPEQGFVGPKLGRHGRYSIGLPPQQLAAAPDGKTFYFVGMGAAATKRRKAKGIHTVAKVTLTEKPKPFIGEPDTPGDDATHLNSPASVATDAKGNIYVADAGNKRVAVFDPDGKPLGQTDVERATQIAVNSNTGELFVLQRQKGRRWGPFDLIKFDKAVGGVEVARLKCTGRNPVFALDAGANPPKLWLSYDAGWGRPPAFVAVSDRGKTLEVGQSVLKGQSGQAFASPLYVSVDPKRERLYVGDFSRKILLVDLKTDKVRKFKTGSEAVVGPDGNVYVLSGYGTNALLRVSPDGKPVPFKATGSNKLSIKYRAGLPHVGVRGLTVAPSGDIYVYQDNNGGPMHLWVFGPDGSLKRKNLIENIPADSANSLAVDRAGNIYAGINVHDMKALFPDVFKGVVPPYGWVNIYSGKSSWYARAGKGMPKGPPWTRMFLNFYINHYGSVFKFPPTGGKFYLGRRTKTPKRPDDAPADAAFYRDAYLDRAVWLKGALWQYRGFALSTNRTQGYGDPGCSCWSGRFAMDESERLFVPDVFRFSVGVVDKNGNEITRFGEYGNVDSAGVGSAIPEPAIPFAWCNAVAVGGGKVYVVDRINRRIAVLDLTYSQEETCKVK